MCLKSIILNILTVKNLIFNFFLVFNLHAFGFSLTEYKNFYSTDGAQVVESLEKIDNKYWSMESKAEHSLFNFYQKSVFYIENDQIYLIEMQRNLRAFGGLRKEKQEYKINQETKEVEFIFNKKSGKLSFDNPLHGNLTLQLQLKFDLDTNKIPLINNYYFLDKGIIKSKKFTTEFNDEENDPQSFKITEIRDDDRAYSLWFKDDEYLTTYKIFNNFGSRTAVWKLDQSRPLEE